MLVAEIIVMRIAVAEIGVVEIAPERVSGFEAKNIMRVFVLGWRRRLQLRARSRQGNSGFTQENDGDKKLDFFHTSK